MATTSYLDKTGLTYLVGKLKSLINTKVDKEDGKGLSTNDYTTAEKNKLAGIAAGAEVNVQSDWNATSGDALILNKPDIITASDVTSSYESAGTAPVNGKAVAAAIGTLDVSNTGSSSKYPTSISQTDGKISTTYTDFSSTYSATGTAGVNGKAIAAALGTLDVSDTAVSGKYVSQVTETDGKIAVTRASLPTSLPASDTTSTYSATGTAPVNGKAVASAISNKADKSTTLSGYGITNAYTKTEVDSAISDAIGEITGLSFSIVTTLPTTGVAGTIYLVPHSHGTNDIYDEYVWLNDSSVFEKIGSTDVDLSDYVKTSDLVAITNDEIDVIVAA